MGNKGQLIDPFKTNTTECRCCDGSGVQRKKDGIRIDCPCCCGSGKVKREKYLKTRCD